jgi:peptide/nickel transport system substrate-binding protein
MDRRHRFVRKGMIFLVWIILGVLDFWAAEAAFALTPAQGQMTPVPKPGGILKIAYASDPGSLDVQKEGNLASFDMASHVLEGLFDYDRNLTPQPMLAKSWQVSPDRLLYTVRLREGVLFHHYKELTAEDVVASIKRALRVARTPPQLASYLEAITAKDKYTVEIRLKEPFPDILYSLTRFIIPKDLAEKYPTATIPDKELVGTGPYRVKDRIPDRYVELVRFDRYCARSEPPNGNVGRKYAHVDKILFYILPDPAVRLMGVESGEYHYAHAVNHADYPRIVQNPQLQARIIKNFSSLGCMFNCRVGPMADIRIRQAAAAALDAEAVMKAAFIYPQLYYLECGFIWPDSKEWYTRAGSAYYNQKNPAKAKRLLREAGYKGEPIIMLGIAEIEYLRNACLVVANQLKNVGLNIDLQLVDQSTFLSRIVNPGKWHMVTSISLFTPSPTLLPWTREKDPIAGWESGRKTRLARLMRQETDPRKRFKAWEEMQQLVYEEAARTKFGNGVSLAATSRKASGWGEMIGPRFWNVRFN